MVETTLSSELTSTEERYLSAWMEKTSRSFALLIPWLEAPLNNYLAIAYLICRMVDNIEDCSQSSIWKQQRFAEAAELLRQPDKAALILNSWQQETWIGLTANEQQFMTVSGGLMLWQIYAMLPETAQGIIHQWVLQMITGMNGLDGPEQSPYFVERQGVQVLAQVTDYNRYCYIVAGTVGHICTELVVDQYRLSAQVGQGLLATCEACGRGLQKTNIIKDFADDLGRGIAYLPAQWLQEVNYAPLLLAGSPLAWSHKILKDALSELAGAVDYLHLLPYDVAGYRMAGLVSLLAAYQTLLLAARKRADLFTINHEVKISRPTMVQCIHEAEKLVRDNEGIRAYGRHIAQTIDDLFTDQPGLPLCDEDAFSPG